MAGLAGGAAAGASSAAAATAKVVGKSSLLWLKWALPAALLSSGIVGTYAYRSTHHVDPAASPTITTTMPVETSKPVGSSRACRSSGTCFTARAKRAHRSARQGATFAQGERRRARGRRGSASRSARRVARWTCGTRARAFARARATFSELAGSLRAQRSSGACPLRSRTRSRSTQDCRSAAQPSTGLSGGRRPQGHLRSEIEKKPPRRQQTPRDLVFRSLQKQSLILGVCWRLGGSSSFSDLALEGELGLSILRFGGAALFRFRSGRRRLLLAAKSSFSRSRSAEMSSRLS